MVAGSARTQLGTGQKPLTASPTQLMPYDSTRIAVVLVNSGTEPAVIGFSPQLDLGDGYPIPPNGFVRLGGQSAVWGVCATGAATVGWIVEYTG